LKVACRLRPLTEEEIIEGSTVIGHKIADDNMIVLMDPMEDPDDILRANRSRERQFVFDMVFDAKSTQVRFFEFYELLGYQIYFNFKISSKLYSKMFMKKLQKVC
jgi:hypothetical protein